MKEERLYNFEEFENIRINWNSKVLRVSKKHVTISSSAVKLIPWMYVTFLTNKKDMILIKKSDGISGKRFKKHMSLSLSKVVPIGKYELVNKDYEGGVLFKN